MNSSHVWYSLCTLLSFIFAFVYSIFVVVAVVVVSKLRTRTDNMYIRFSNRQKKIHIYICISWRIHFILRTSLPLFHLHSLLFFPIIGVASE